MTKIYLFCVAHVELYSQSYAHTNYVSRICINGQFCDNLWYTMSG